MIYRISAYGLTLEDGDVSADGAALLVLDFSLVSVGAQCTCE